MSPRLPAVLLFAVVLALCEIAAAQDTEKGLEQAIQSARTIVPRTAADFAPSAPAAAIEKSCREIDGLAARLGTFHPNANQEDVLKRVERLIVVKAELDRLLDEAFNQRRELVKDPSATDRAALRNYLRIVGTLLDLSGRLDYQLRDSINDAAYRVAANRPLREKFLEMLTRHRSPMGAEVMAWLLFDPPANSPNGAVPASVAEKRQVLRLIYATGNIEQIPLLARFLREEKRYPELTVAAAAVLRHVGFPQEQRPGDKAEESRPPITAGQLAPILRSLPAGSLGSESAKLRDDLLKWLEERKDQGLVGDSCRLANAELHPGDWMLMRNPSPYNRFTDLSPGLFTHVGVLAIEKGKDGRRRMVVVDLPERGTHIQATNVDVFIRLTRHCLFLRHPDPRIAQSMADTAAGIIGNESVFDLNFRIDPVLALKGQPKAGKVIKTYCAGMLLLCGQETGLDRSRIFPVSEKVAPGKTEMNLKEMGVQFGPNFVSPSGPLFAKDFVVAGRRMPVYAPTAEIAEAVYDHFAECMAKYDLAGQRDSYQQTRLRLAEAAKTNPALARLLGQLNNVNPAMDLVAAAKTAAVVENLDRVANRNSGDYTDAFFALTCGPLERLKGEYKKEEIEQFARLRERHADLFRQIMAGQIDPRGFRLALVGYYVKRGQAEIEKQFKVSEDSPKR